MERSPNFYNNQEKERERERERAENEFWKIHVQIPNTTGAGFLKDEDSINSLCIELLQ